MSAMILLKDTCRGLGRRAGKSHPVAVCPCGGAKFSADFMYLSIIYVLLSSIYKNAEVKFDKTNRRCILKSGGCITGILRYAKITEVLYADRKQRKKTERA